MKTACSLLGLFAVANAQSGYLRTTGANKCPLVHGQDARPQTKDACQDAANTLGIRWGGDAGLDDWQDGCIVNHGSAYWVGLSENDIATHGDHNGGSICLSEASNGLRHARQWCGPNGGRYGQMISTFAECQAAAASLGFGFHNDVNWDDKNWFSGCITQPHENGGKGHKAYFVGYDANFEATGMHTRETDRHFNHHNLMGGYICKNSNYDLKTPAPPAPCSWAPYTEEKEYAWGAKTCDDKATDFRLHGPNMLAHRVTNFCKVTNGAYSSTWGKRCPKWCCLAGMDIESA